MGPSKINGLAEAPADPELQKRWGANFSRNFSTTFLGVSRTNFGISRKNFIHLPKFLMTFHFLVIVLLMFSCMAFFVGGAKSVADIDTGGQKPYFSTYSQSYHYSFYPQGRPNSIANFDGGPWPELPPSGSATLSPSGTLEIEPEFLLTPLWKSPFDSSQRS